MTQQLFDWILLAVALAMLAFALAAWMQGM